MCGIAGIIGSTSTDDARRKVNSALEAMRHRGPDHRDVYKQGPLVLGHVRLSILDLTDAGNQPMTDASGRYSLAFNGEIFNHHELRQTLASRGVQFSSRSDAEVLLHWMIHFGTGGITQLNGFFAFAFFDAHEDELMLVRDRFGEKPLWYSHTYGKLAFASEGKAIRLLRDSANIDPVALHSYLLLTYIPAPYSIHSGIFKLEPGHYLKWKKGIVEVKNWFHEDLNRTIIRSDRATLKTLLDDAVRIRLEADVPVGALLSGGLDSSIIAALAAQYRDDLQTFSVTFPNAPFLDESDYSQKMARHIGSRHMAIPLDEDELFASFEGFVSSIDEPFADASAVAMYALSKVVSGNVRAVLSGDGADELFAGYRKHKAWILALKFSGLQQFLLNGFMKLSGSRASDRGRAGTNRYRQLVRYAEGLPLDGFHRYLHWASFSDPRDVNDLLSLRNNDDLFHRLKVGMESVDGDPLRAMLHADQRMVLPNDMLVKTDLMSMAHSLEIRAPFLDHRVASFASELETRDLIHRGKGKYILRKTFADLLPVEILNRPKRGFEIPLDQWIRGRLRDEVHALPGCAEFNSLSSFEPSAISKLIARSDQRPDSRISHLLFSLIVLRKWLQGNQS